jgi:hypothetical protein
MPQPKGTPLDLMLPATSGPEFGAASPSRPAPDPLTAQLAIILHPTDQRRKFSVEFNGSSIVTASEQPVCDAARALQVVIEPTARGRKWTASLNDRVLCVTVWPFVMSARLLLAEGYPADAEIQMWRPNASEFALRGRLDAVAATVIDGETASRRAKNGSPIRFPGMSASTTPAGGSS